MTPLFYKGNGQRPEKPRELPKFSKLDEENPADYQADDGLVKAVNVAILMGQPLLLNGQPGTGKTQLAGALAHELGLGKPLRFQARTTAKARELFYTYDPLGRLNAVNSTDKTEHVDTRRYVRYTALGEAILRTCEPEVVKHLVAPDALHSEKMRSVVLIDEIDKAPRDFTNDLLAEIVDLTFDVPELDRPNMPAKIRVDPDLRPIIVITSNSEKPLPDAFLRRCVFYDIPPPRPEVLREIVRKRLAREGEIDNKFLEEALMLFSKLQNVELSRAPSTAELLGWLRAMRRSYPDAPNPLQSNPQVAIDTLGLLAKTKDDVETAAQIFRSAMPQLGKNAA